MRKLTWICVVIGLLFSFGTAQAATVITTPQQLQDIVNDLSGDYVLGVDIDLTGFPWAGIGHSMQDPFTGTFDGDFHIINGLTATDDLSQAPYKDTSLFGIVGVGGVVKNVGLTNVDISAGWYGGALVGDLKGEVSKCFVEGGTVSTMVKGGNDGTLIGLVRGTGVVKDSYSTAEFEILPGEFSQYKGGLTGGIAGKATNVYYAGAITGDGIMTGAAAPFAGYVNDELMVTGAYYDKDLAGLDDGNRGRTTAEMMTQATFEGYDFENTWTIREGESYPTLIGFGLSFDPTDFDQDGDSDLDDLNALTDVGNLPVGLPVALSDPKFDLTGDDMINSADLDQWLTDAATINGLGSPYLKGDANLDGDCDVFAIDGSGDAQILSSNLGTASGAVWGDADFNGDGDVDVFAIDGTGDAQLLSSNLGSSSDVAAGTVEAIYNAMTGELSFDVGEGIAVVGIEAAALMHENVDTDSTLGAPAQNGGGILAYFNASGLPVVMADVGAVLSRGLTAEDIGFSYTPIGGDSTVVPVTVIVPEPSTVAMLLLLGIIALCRYRRS